jgi:hypothetical protein
VKVRRIRLEVWRVLGSPARPGQDLLEGPLLEYPTMEVGARYVRLANVTATPYFAFW